jgi:hypothetical protein
MNIEHLFHISKDHVMPAYIFCERVNHGLMPGREVYDLEGVRPKTGNHGPYSLKSLIRLTKKKQATDSVGMIR